MKITPIIINGILSHCPILIAMLSSKLTWFSLKNSSTKRSIHKTTQSSPNINPGPTVLRLFFQNLYKNKCPGNVGYFTDDLAVDEISNPDTHACQRNYYNQAIK